MKDITEIFQDYYVYIYNFALKLTCHPDDALDITQETFIKAWHNLHQLKNEEALAKWLRSICYHTFLMKMRMEKRMKLEPVQNLWELEQEGAVQDLPLPDEEVVVADEIKDLQNGCFLAMVRKLSLNQRIAFSLVDMFGMKIEEVADILDVTKGAAKGLLYRARMNIDSFFADHCSIIYEKNPCSCKAWIQFSTDRWALQKKIKDLNAQLDYAGKGYHYNETVRRKIVYLYSHMPEKKPPKEWYDKVIASLKNN